ncbi:hypothetical protein, partial [Pararhodobacter sp.]|uniref:hypothetical protein n=1 Tax=Pararhodobacter sp. TaxID=2127056 RepID=UPI002FDD1BDE
AAGEALSRPTAKTPQEEKDGLMTNFPSKRRQTLVSLSYFLPFRPTYPPPARAAPKRQARKLAPNSAARKLSENGAAKG